MVVLFCQPYMLPVLLLLIFLKTLIIQRLKQDLQAAADNDEVHQSVFLSAAVAYLEILKGGGGHISGVHFQKCSNVSTKIFSHEKLVQTREFHYGDFPETFPSGEVSGKSP